jgi:chemotaxis protein MotB
MNKQTLCAAALALVAACGIPKDQYNAKALEAEDLGRKYKDEEGKTASLEQKVKDLDGQLLNKEAERKRLEQKNAELSALNDELGRSTKKLAQAKEELEKKSSEYENLAQSLKGEIQTGKIELSELKGKMTVKMKDKILFASGSARIGKEGQEALAKVADAFKNLQGKIVRVEGHTDDVPTDPKSAFPSNWELSLARAMAVVKYMQDQGVDPTLLSAAGYGQYHPIAPNDSPENRSQNRRIEIVLAPAG